MNARRKEAVRRGVPFLSAATFLAVAGIVLVQAAPVLGQEATGPAVARVEEDWELVLNEPDNSVDSPQFHTVMAPGADASRFYAQVVWNYREYPDFMPGGLELQGWYGDELLRSRVVRSQSLSTTAETITWTQVLELASDGLYFEIVNGMSATWGFFGRDMRLLQGGTFATLAGYNTETSVTNSGITYGANRVDRLTITMVRKYAADGSLISVDYMPKTVYEYVEAADEGADWEPLWED